MGGMSEYTSWTAGIPWWISFPGFLLGLAIIGLAPYRYLIKSTSGSWQPKGAKGIAAIEGRIGRAPRGAYALRLVPLVRAPTKNAARSMATSRLIMIPIIL
jgi:hypothetical protein